MRYVWKIIVNKKIQYSRKNWKKSVLLHINVEENVFMPIIWPWKAENSSTLNTDSQAYGKRGLKIQDGHQKSIEWRITTHNSIYDCINSYNGTLMCSNNNRWSVSTPKNCQALHRSEIWEWSSTSAWLWRYTFPSWQEHASISCEEFDRRRKTWTKTLSKH